ncbi:MULTISPECIES: ATP-dependent DNA helicase [unclassified Massilia]|uniref:ATP-dependent DNA helicase n=1 Tax=unclassified Massilia TaxID=2609279 RepID=UPI00177F7768|nr:MULTISPECIES: ATP-dependent DNA helicase [unclassified Massilia]MBD8531162.1 ATP-dependent DNA helicase [Massilia sp. CFBP 13647]MBD8674998.1 ATP-dependent DNA helicase [Massilia sp. CFBP 13721]
MTAPAYVVAVRALCEFTAKRGDLDLRFTPSPTAQEGIAGHQVVTARRGDGYQAEVSLAGDFGPLHVRGRADGYDPAQHLLEEIKTYRGQLSSMPDNHRHLHWAQLRVYGHLLCAARGLDSVNLALVYYEIGSGLETSLRETRTAAELEAMFEDACGRFVAWAEQELRHREARDAALAGLRFPHADFRPGQRQLAETVFKANSTGRCLLAQAPTGIGKTIGSLFPVLKAAPAQRIDKIFFLAAKTPGRQLALDAAQAIRSAAPGLPLRVLELAARDKACEHPDKACHGESCPLARGFYDRLPAARQAALGVPVLDRAALRDIGLAHDVCPYYLGSEMARWTDVAIGDYNYYFDGSAMLYALAQANGWRASVLVDEAHNMVSRARSMYSCELDRTVLRAARAAAPPLVKKALSKIARAWGQIDADAPLPYQVLGVPNDKLLTALANATSTINDFVAENPGPLDAALQRFHFDAMAFARLAESFGEHSLCDLTRQGKDSLLCIRNVVPAPFLKPRFEGAHSVTLFSATLSPWHYFADLLGMPENTGWIDVESPFTAGQLAVHVANRISTRYQHRSASLAPIARLMGEQYAQAPGNYLAFFSSFDYLEQAASLFAQQYPDVPIWRQERRMSEGERAAFLDRFQPDGRGIGFAVLGGSFGEGIDLPGARLIGAFVATLGLPQLNPVNEQLRTRMQAMFGAGYDYTYLYPGLQKVVQAAGRVIRTEQDLGVVYLIDDRFDQPAVRELLPRWWQVERLIA